MAYSDRQRIAVEKNQPRVLTLWQALQPLRTCISFMSSGAHPDDETSAMLASLSYQYGIDISYACANRGEGGQNDIGMQSEQALGALRTAEMERACDVLNMRLYWLSESPQDSIFDFGFSKSGAETLQRWGLERTLERFVDIVRRAKPDILCTTFLDVTGQHGHHCAMTQAAEQVVQLAADPNYPNSELAPWQVSKLYIPGWSGAGQAYDDDAPPPATDVTIHAKGYDSISGWSYERIGQQSRAFHQTQGMGSWVAAGDERDWPLHLSQSFVETTEQTVLSGLAVNLAQLNVPEIDSYLHSAQTAIDECIKAFPTAVETIKYASEALRQVRQAIEHCPASATTRIAHRLTRKEQQLSRVIYLASEIQINAYIEEPSVCAQQSFALHTELRSNHYYHSSRAVLPTGWQLDNQQVTLNEHAAIHNAYPTDYDPLQPAPPYIEASVESQGIQSHSSIALEHFPVVLPVYRAELNARHFVINNDTKQRTVEVKLKDIHPLNAKLSIDTPAGWNSQISGDTIKVTLPDTVECGRYKLAVQLDENPAYCVDSIEFSHIANTALSQLAEIEVAVIAVTTAPARVGYLGAGNDNVAHWLGQIGVELVELDETTLVQALDSLDTLIFGILTLRTRNTLQQLLPRIHNWVEMGGNWLTLYHRPWDNWDSQHTAVRPLEIGQPSLRWRVTDQNATVTHLQPEHPLLNWPNRLGADDWANWQKERGLYFAKSWHSDYRALISMQDPEESALEGALVSARYGLGRHTHCALILHHQMAKLVPGAFAIMANLIAPCTELKE